MAKKVIDSTYLEVNLQNLVSNFLDFRYLKVVSELPASANSNIVFLYIGETIDTEQLKCYKGGLYNYNNGWVEIPNRLSAEVDKKQNKSGGDFTGDISVNLSGDASKPYVKTDYENGALHINSKQGAYTDYKIGKVERTVSGNTYEQNYPNKSGTFVVTDYNNNTDLNGLNTIENGVYRSVAEGYSNTLDDNWTDACHVEGFYNVVSGSASHGEGHNNTAMGDYSHAEGDSNTVSGQSAHAEGYTNTVTALYGHAEGGANTVSGEAAHAEGTNNTASGARAHAEGYGTTARGQYAHAEGASTTASGEASHAQNNHTVAGYPNQSAMGTYNNNKSTNLVEVGNGADDNNRSNAMEVTADGDLLIKNGGVSLYGLDENKDLLGVKNLLPLTLENLKAINTTGTWSGNAYTLNGVTFTVNTNSHGSVTDITVNGTKEEGSASFLVIFNSLLLDNNMSYWMTGGATGVNVGARYTVTPYDFRLDNGNGIEVPFERERVIYIDVVTAETYTNVKIYPMIRLDTDPNPTYKPYAMSNQELTQRLLALEARLSSNINSIELET
jgi:hypothetical protein